MEPGFIVVCLLLTEPDVQPACISSQVLKREPQNRSNVIFLQEVYAFGMLP